MDLDFTDEQEALRESVRSVLARECPIGLVRAVVETGDRSAVDALWRRMVDLDWPALTVPEDVGGLGLSFVELGVLAEEAGGALVPGPLLPTLAQFAPAVRELGDAGQRARFLGAVARGELTGTLAPGPSVSASPAGDGVVLEGSVPWVVEASHVDEIAVVVTTDGDPAVAVVPQAEVDVEPARAFDPTREYATVRFDGVRVGADRVLGDVGGAGTAVVRAIEDATVAVALETLGTCQAILDMTVAYAGERVQFDRPIGSFQAVKHKLADMLVVVERARACCYFAAACIAEDDDRRTMAVSVAKAAAGDAQRKVAEDGIQLHGGIGYTWEHDLHLYVKRAKAGDALFGTAAEHRQRIAALLAERVRTGGTGTSAHSPAVTDGR